MFEVNVSGTEQKDMVFTFFKSLEGDGNSIGGEEFEESAETKSPLLRSFLAWWYCKVVGEVGDAEVRREDEAQPCPVFLTATQLDGNIKRGPPTGGPLALLPGWVPLCLGGSYFPKHLACIGV